MREKRGVKSPRFDLPNGNRICSSCNIERQIDEFIKDKKCSRGFARKCKQCAYDSRDKEKMSEVKKECYRKNKEKYKERIKQNTARYLEDGRQSKWAIKWQKANPDKVAEIKHRRRTRKMHNGRNDLTAEQIRQIKSTGICYYCNEQFDNLSIDHVVPLSKGGENTLSNVVAACIQCNKRKNAKLVEEFNGSR